MDSRYYVRPVSPGGRRMVAPERSSTGGFSSQYDSHQAPRSGRDQYASPRTSGERVSQPPYLAHPSSSSSRSGAAYESYTGRPRRSTLTESDGKRPSHSSTNLTPAMPIRQRPVIHTALDVPATQLARSWDDRSSGGYMTPATTAPRREHKKTYSVDNSGQSILVDDRDYESRKRDSGGERGGYRSSGIGGSRQGYHLSGPLVRPQEVVDEYYSYTDPAGMYRDTEPRWRQRRRSVDRGSRPTSMTEGLYGPDPRKSKEVGPPPSTRGFDKLNDKIGSSAGLSRSGSLRERERSSSRDRSGSHFNDPEHALPHRSATARTTAVHQDRDERERYPYYEERPGRSHNGQYDDPDVAVRGFGIRTDTMDRFSNRGSDESFEDPLYTSPATLKQPDIKDYMLPASRDERREPDRREQDYVDRERDRPHERDRDRDRERDRERDRDRDWNRERERRRDTDVDSRVSDERDHRTSGAIPAATAAAAVAAYGASEAIDRQAREKRYEEAPEELPQGRHKLTSSDSAEPIRERHYEADVREDRKKESRKEASSTIDPDEEYRRRVQQEKERSSKAARDRDSDSDRERPRRERERDRPMRDAPRDIHNMADLPPPPPRPVDRQNLPLGGQVVQEPTEIADMDSVTGEKKVKIVDPPRGSPPPPKSILKQPTQKFPEHPNPIREGVAPLKDAKKGKDIPVDARWTKIDRRLVNPAALDEAKERFEERMDCVIVLRVLTKDEIQKLADRTREIREEREHDSDRRDRHRDHDRERDRDYDERDRDGRRHHRREYDSAGSYDDSDGDNYKRDPRDRSSRQRTIEGAPPSAPLPGERRDHYIPGAYPGR